MKLIKKIGNIELDSFIEWLNFDTVQTIISEVEATITGGAVVWELETDESSHLINISSGNNFGFQSKQTKDNILTLARNSIGTTTTITTFDDEIINVRFRHEDGAVEVSDLINARLSNHYSIKINLAKV